MSSASFKDSMRNWLPGSLRSASLHWRIASSMTLRLCSITAIVVESSCGGAARPPREAARSRCRMSVAPTGGRRRASQSVRSPRSGRGTVSRFGATAGVLATTALRLPPRLAAWRQSSAS